MASRGFKLDNQINELGCFPYEEPTPLGSWDQQFACAEGFNLDIPHLLDFHPFPLLSDLTTITPPVDDFQDISADLPVWDFDQPPAPPQIHNVMNPNPVMIMQQNDNHVLVDPKEEEEDVCTRMYASGMQHHQMEFSKKEEITRHVRCKSSALQLDEIKKYFDLPITRAAKELKVGLTVLKKRCRELNINRWPHRKIKSLKSLINNVKELGLTTEIAMLEEHKRMVEKIPEMDLTERTKKLRQACFKANYKKRRLLQEAAHLP